MRSSDSKEYILVKGEPDYRKDKDNNALVNIDKNQFDKYKARKAIERAKEDRLIALESKLDTIIQMLETIVENTNGNTKLQE